MKAKDIIKDVLNNEKSITQNMAVALNEASCDKIYNFYLDIFNDVSKESKILFNIAYNEGWYTLEKITKTKLKETITKLNSELNN